MHYIDFPLQLIFIHRATVRVKLTASRSTMAHSDKKNCRLTTVNKTAKYGLQNNAKELEKEVISRIFTSYKKVRRP